MPLSPLGAVMQEGVGWRGFAGSYTHTQTHMHTNMHRFGGTSSLLGWGVRRPVTAYDMCPMSKNSLVTVTRPNWGLANSSSTSSPTSMAEVRMVPTCCARRSVKPRRRCTAAPLARPTAEGRPAHLFLLHVLHRAVGRIVVVDLVEEVAVGAHVRVLRLAQPRLSAVRGVRALVRLPLYRLALHKELLLALQPLAVPLHRNVLREFVPPLGVVGAEAQLTLPKRLLLQVAWLRGESARASPPAPNRRNQRRARLPPPRWGKSATRNAPSLSLYGSDL